MESFLQVQTNRPEPVNHQEGPREGQLKARFPDLYFGKSHMDCYHFCQKCKDHFDTARATGTNRTSFGASFLRGSISLRWTQYKRRHRLDKGEDVPVPWEEFKSFLRQNLGDSRAFVAGIWSKFKRDSQYQYEEVQDWASHLEHLQSILLEFDANGAPEETDLIRYFQEALKPSIKAEMENQVEEYEHWEELVRKTIAAEAKAALRPSSYVREMDQHCPRGNRPAYATSVKAQGSSMKDPRSQDYKPKSSGPGVASGSGSGSGPQRTDSESFSRSKKRKGGPNKKKSDTPASGVNTTEAGDGQKSKKQRRQERNKRDVKDVTCYNCDKKGHYATTCPKPRKTKN